MTLWILARAQCRYDSFGLTLLRLSPTRGAMRMLTHFVTRRAFTMLMLGVLAVSTAACAGESSKTAPPEGLATSATSATSAGPSPSTLPPTKDPDDWKGKYSPSQLAAYDAALQRFESFESRSDPIYAKGRATPAAEKLFKEFFPHPIWMSYWENLQTYEEYEVKSTGTPEIYWSRAKSITNSSGGVVIAQCVDYRSTTTTQYGKPTKPIASRQEPVLREIHLSKPDGYDWLIYALITTPGANGKKDEPCDPDL